MRRTAASRYWRLSRPVWVGPFQSQSYDHSISYSIYSNQCRALAEARVVETVGQSLMVEDTAVQMVKKLSPPSLRQGVVTGNVLTSRANQIATECLYTLYSKPFFDDDDFESLVCPMYFTQTLELFKNIFNWVPVDPNDIDEERYLFLKRFSEVQLHEFRTKELILIILPANCHSWRIHRRERRCCTSAGRFRRLHGACSPYLMP